MIGRNFNYLAVQKVAFSSATMPPFQDFKKKKRKKKKRSSDDKAVISSQHPFGRIRKKLLL